MKYKFLSALKYFIMLAFALLTLTNCQTTQRTRFLRKQYKEIYIDQFKLTYLRKLMLKGYNNSPAIREVLKSDHSGFTEPVILEEDFKLIDSLTTLDNLKMIIDSAEGKRRAEGSQGKRPIGFIFEKAKSKWLDSLAKSRYKISGLSKETFE